MEKSSVLERIRLARKEFIDRQLQYLEQKK